jgi:hypothetical protein
MSGGMTIPAKRRALAKVQAAPPRGLSIIPHLGRIASVCGNAVNKVPQPVRKITVGSARVASFSVLCVLVLALMAAGGLYAALMRGPISIRFLVAPIERVVNASLTGVRFDIGDAVLRRADDSYGVEFRLADVQLMDASGERIVEAPLASADLSLSALLAGRLAPEQVELIGPRLFLHYSEEKGLAVSTGNAVGPQGAVTEPGGRRVLGARPDAATPQPGDTRLSRITGAVPSRERPVDAAPAAPLNLTKVLNDLFAQTRLGESAYLTSFGIRDAIVFFDRGEHITRWDVPVVAIDLTHENKNSAVLGNLTIRSGTESWQVKFRADQNRRNGELGLNVSIDDINPRLLSAEFPNIKFLKICDMPVDVSADLDLSGQGDILKADIRATLRPGLLYMPWDDKHPSGIDHGNFHLAYSRDDGRIEIQPSEIRRGASRI